MAPEGTPPVGVGEEGAGGLETEVLEEGGGAVGIPVAPRREGAGTSETGAGEGEGQPTILIGRPPAGGMGETGIEVITGTTPGGHETVSELAEGEEESGRLPEEGTVPGGTAGEPGTRPGVSRRGRGVRGRIPTGARGPHPEGVSGTEHVSEFKFQ